MERIQYQRQSIDSAIENLREEREFLLKSIEESKVVKLQAEIKKLREKYEGILMRDKFKKREAILEYCEVQGWLAIDEITFPKFTEAGAVKYFELKGYLQKNTI